MYTHIQTLGPYNSGTNLVNNILKTQLLSDETPDGNTHIWKHTFKQSILERVIEEHPTTLFVVCYRPMYSWIKSTERSTYKLNWDKRLDTTIELLGQTFPSISHLYDHYYRMYQVLIERYDNVIAVEYFKVCDPEYSYEYMERKLAPFSISLPTKKEFADLLNKPSKIHGHSVLTSQEAIENKRDLDGSKPPVQLSIRNDIVHFYEALSYSAMDSKISEGYDISCNTFIAP
jgi:hypothetical protein